MFARLTSDLRTWCQHGVVLMAIFVSRTTHLYPCSHPSMVCMSVIGRSSWILFLSPVHCTRLSYWVELVDYCHNHRNYILHQGIYEKATQVWEANHELNFLVWTFQKLQFYQNLFILHLIYLSIITIMFPIIIHLEFRDGHIIEIQLAYQLISSVHMRMYLTIRC